MAHRLGHATTGLRTTARGWSGGITVYLFNKEGEDWCTVCHEVQTGASTKTIYHGPLNKHTDPRGVIIPLNADKEYP